MQDLGEIRARLARERGAIHDAEGGTTLAVPFVTAHGDLTPSRASCDAFAAYAE